VQPAPDLSAARILPDHFDPDPRLQQLLDRLTGYYPRGIDPGLERTLRLLKDLGNPHLKLPPVLHVAGTNGKGSVLAYLRAMFEAAGLVCHVMTSPHLVRFNERLVVSGVEISTSDILALFEEVETLNAGQETTAFELITAAGFLAFSRSPADVTLVEVGMGGRFDATNVIPHPLMSIITVISKDHTKFLGHDLKQIAFEKGGIIKEKTPCVVGPQIHADVFKVFEDIARDKNSLLLRHGSEWSFDVLSERIILHTLSNLYDLPHPNLVGFHQFGNAATAAMAMLELNGRLTKGVMMPSIEQGLCSARWPARLQKISKGPLTELLPDDCELWIDGGHNDSCGRALSDQARIWADQDRKDLHLILGMLTTKDPCEFFEPLCSLSSSVHTVTIPNQALSFSADDLKVTLGGKFDIDISSAMSLKDAVCACLNIQSDSSKRILITGSLYLMGSILEQHQ
jgi:dihydrofolate synthase/folylpolyglutamate synthase